MCNCKISDVSGQPNVYLSKKKLDHSKPNNCSTYSHHHWYSSCAFIMLKHNVWYLICYCLVNPYCATSNICSHQDGRVTTTVYASRCQAVWILLLQRSCMLFIVSSVTPPCIKKYIRGQDPLVLCASAFFKLNYSVASGRQSPENMVARPFS